MLLKFWKFTDLSGLSHHSWNSLSLTSHFNKTGNSTIMEMLLVSDFLIQKTDLLWIIESWPDVVILIYSNFKIIFAAGCYVNGPDLKNRNIKRKITIFFFFLTLACDYLSFSLLCIILLVSSISQKTWSHLLEWSWKLIACNKNLLLLKDDRTSQAGATINFTSKDGCSIIFIFHEIVHLFLLLTTGGTASSSTGNLFIKR